MQGVVEDNNAEIPNKTPWLDRVFPNQTPNHTMTNTETRYTAHRRIRVNELTLLVQDRLKFVMQ